MRGRRSSASPSVESTLNDDCQDDGGPNNNKRRRIALACSTCRIRKSRCNGHRPRCSLCERMGFECTYEMPNSSSNLIIGKDIFAAFEARVEAIEEELRNQKGHAGLLTQNAAFATPSPLNIVEEDVPHRLDTPPGMVAVTIQDNLESSQQAENDKTDGMAMSLVEEEDYSFFGPTSNIALMRSIFRAVAFKRASITANLSSKEQTNMNSTGAINLSRAFPDSPSLVGDGETVSIPGGCNILPSHDETEKLIRQYFSNTGTLFPYIHEPSFLETYQHMRNHNFRVNVRRTYLGLLNMVLAMAAWSESGRQSNTTPTSATEPDVFYRRAQEICRRQMLRGTTLETVQFLLLTSQYLQGTQKSVQTWTVHGLAVKGAISIGIHSQKALRKLPEIEQEMGKRTWFGCVLLDRHLSMTFGRPSAISDDYVRLELPRLVQGDNIDNSGILFYTGTITLYKILWQIMGGLYGHNMGCEETADTNVLTQIFQLQHELNEWQASLPPEIAIVSMEDITNVNPNNPRVGRYRFVLTLRYLNTQLLLHRPVLTKLLNTELDPSQPHKPISQMQLNLSEISTGYARDIICIVHTVLTRPDLGRHFLGAWWFTLYYVFNASLVVFGSLLVHVAVSDTLLGGHSQMKMGQQVLGQAIEALIHLDQDNHLLDRCVSYLKDVVRVVEGWGKSTKAISRCSSLNPSLSATGSVLAAWSPVTVLDPNISAAYGHILMHPPGLLDKTNADLSLGEVSLEGNVGFVNYLEFDPSFNNEFQRWFGNNAWSADIL